MRKYSYLLVIMFALLPVMASAQLYNGMPPPQDFRAQNSVVFTETGDYSTSAFVMTKTFEYNKLKNLAALSYSDITTVHSWWSVNMLDRDLWVLFMPRYSIESEVFAMDIATTYHIGRARLNAHLHDFEQYTLTAGYRFHQRIAANVGARDLKPVANVRIWLIDNHWIEYRYYDHAHGIHLFFHFN